MADNNETPNTTPETGTQAPVPVPDPLKLFIAAPDRNQNGSLRLNLQEASPAQLDPSVPKIVVLSGMLVNYDPDRTSKLIMEGAVINELRVMPNGLELPLNGVEVVTVGYPNAKKNSDLYEQAIAPTEGSRENPYSPASAKLADAFLGDVKDYNKLSADERTVEIQRLQKALGSNVFVGMSTGSEVSAGLQNAVIAKLEQNGFPHDLITSEITPHLKIVNYASEATQQYHPNRAPTGATVLDVASNKDQMAKALAEQRGTLIPEVGTGSGTTLAAIDNGRAAIMAVTLPDLMYKPKATGGTDPIENESGHHALAFTTAVLGDKQNGPTTYTPLAGHTVENFMENALENARANAASAHGGVLPPTAIQMATTPSQEMQKNPELAKDYEGYMHSVTADNGTPKTPAEIFSGRLVAQTPLIENSKTIIAQTQFTDIGDGMLAFDTAQLSDAARHQLLASISENGIEIRGNQGTLYSIDTHTLPPWVQETIKPVGTGIPQGVDEGTLKGWKVSDRTTMEVIDENKARLSTIEAHDGKPARQVLELTFDNKALAEHFAKYLPEQYPRIKSLTQDGEIVRIDVEEVRREGLLGKKPDKVLSTLTHREPENAPPTKEVHEPRQETPEPKQETWKEEVSPIRVRSRETESGNTTKSPLSPPKAPTTVTVKNGPKHDVVETPTVAEVPTVKAPPVPQPVVPVVNPQTATTSATTENTNPVLEVKMTPAIFSQIVGGNISGNPQFQAFNEALNFSGYAQYCIDPKLGMAETMIQYPEANQSGITPDKYLTQSSLDKLDQLRTKLASEGKTLADVPAEQLHLEFDPEKVAKINKDIELVKDTFKEIRRLSPNQAEADGSKARMVEAVAHLEATDITVGQFSAAINAARDLLKLSSDENAARISEHLSTVQTKLGDYKPLESPKIGMTMNGAQIVSSLTEFAQNRFQPSTQMIVPAINGTLGVGGLTAELMGAQRVSVGVGGTMGVITLVTSGYHAVQDFRQGNVVGGTLNTATAASGGAFSLATAATFMGDTAAAEAYTGVGTTIAIPTAALALTLTAADAYDQRQDYLHFVQSTDATMNQRTKPAITREFEDIGLPLKPKVSEYANLQQIDILSEGGFAKYANTHDLPEVEKYISNHTHPKDFEKRQHTRDAANDRLTRGFGSSTAVGIITGVQDHDLNRADKAQEQMEIAKTGQGALQEMSGQFEGNSPHKPRGYSERMAQYNQVLKPLEGEYHRQIEALEKLPELYREAGARQSVNQIAAGLPDHSPGENLYFRQVIAPGYDQLQQNLKESKKELVHQEETLATEKAKLASHTVIEQVPPIITPYSGGLPQPTSYSREMTNEEKTTLQKTIAADEKKLTELQSKTETLQNTYNEQHELVSGYYVSKQMEKNIAAEKEYVDKLPNQAAKDDYFRKNKEFIEKAHLQGRKDLSLIALSTSQQELDSKVALLPAQRIERAQAVSHTMEAETNKLQEHNDAMKKELEGLGRKPTGIDMPAVDAQGKPIMKPVLDKDGKPQFNKQGEMVTEQASAQDVRNALDKNVAAEMETIKKLHKQVDQYGAITAKVNLAEHEATLSSLKDNIAKIDEKTLSYQLQEAKKAPALQTTEQSDKDKTKVSSIDALVKDKPHLTAALANFAQSLVKGTGAQSHNPAIDVSANLSLTTNSGSKVMGA